ncbi:MAG: rod shape-determining protein MreC [Candidatus Ornithomonoglobus sp.]
MKFFSKKWRVILIIAVLLAAAGFGLEHFTGYNPVSTVVNTIAAPVKTGFSYIASSVANFRDFIWDMRAYKEDNARLVAENNELKMMLKDVSAYREENENLQELLDLKNSMVEYSTVAARVISYSGNNWYELVEINKGSLSGLAVGNAVLTEDGVVGRITSVGPNYSIVRTILDSESAVGIKVSRTEGSGLVEGDDELIGSAQCKLSFLDRNTPLIVGDIVETSGTGGIFPAGFVVGTVMSISADSTGALNYAVINPAVDFDKLSEVLVINGEY